MRIHQELYDHLSGKEQAKYMCQTLEAVWVLRAVLDSTVQDACKMGAWKLGCQASEVVAFPRKASQ
jgi:hypothetical protein